MNASSFPSRIVIVGCCGSGKSTLAEAIVKALGHARIELDALHWEPEWTEVPTEVLRERVSEAILGERWVLDGNYSKVRDLIWPRAEVLIWLDFSFHVVMWRVIMRTIQRCAGKELLWGTNHETWLKSFASRDSIIWWAATHWMSYRRQYTELIQHPDHAHLQVMRLQVPLSTDDIIAQLVALQSRPA